jgi:hypothetical protein
MTFSRNLPAGYRVGRASAADAAHVERQLRGVDRAEMEALEGRPALQVLTSWIGDTSRVLTIHGEPTVLFGVVASEDLRGHAMPWSAAATTMPFDDTMNVLWLSRLQIEFWQRRWPVLQSLCDVRNSFHRQWLEWLDFQPQGRVESFGAARLPFDLYRRSRGPTLH